MHATELLELSALLVERGIIVTDVMPFCLLNPNHAAHSLGRITRDVSNDDIAEAFGITVIEFLRERDSSPSLEDAVGVLMAMQSARAKGEAWLVRYYLPSPRGGYITKLVFAHTLADVMHRMLRA